MEPSVTEWITHQLKPSKLAYLSCSAGTLKRDLDQFTSANYEVNSVIPFDFFPQTYHVECIVRLRSES
jgi:tRNA/tmRNA/rRNA uracil-C5-methylase (TrmA/RlmC/RlmD family)